MDRFTSGKTLIYKSASIVERRRRILAEARRMIATEGVAGFNVRDLCARAHIAQKTLYNAFGSKENVISMAIRQYLADFMDRVVFTHDQTSVKGRLERYVKVHSRNTQIRPYTTAIMSVYNSPTAEGGVREAIREVAETALMPYAEAVAGRRNFAPGVTPQRYVQMSVTTQYAVLTDWCVGAIADEALVDRVCEMFLVVLEGASVGATRQEAGTWLRRLRAGDEEWMALRRHAAARPAELGTPSAG